MQLYVVEESEYHKWRSAATDYGRDGVIHLLPSKFYAYLPKNVYRISTSHDELVSSIIERVTGETPRHYTESELKDAILSQNSESLRHVAPHEVLDEAFEIARYTPTYSLKLPEFSSRSWLSGSSFESDETIGSNSLLDGTLLLLNSSSLDDIRARATQNVWVRHAVPCLRFVRHADDFLSQVIQSPKAGAISSLAGDRAKIGLLYTDEDVEVASYVRQHFDALDKMSGNKFDVFFIENPAAVKSLSFWRRVLPESIFILWSMVGFVRSLPYDKSDAYLIAESLNVSPNALPCAVCLGSHPPLSVNKIVSLRGPMTRTFRNLFSDVPMDSSTFPGIIVDEDQAVCEEPPLCFLSHNSQDKDVVHDVAAILHASGIECWLDEWEILPGDNITKKISAGLEQATHLVFFMSQASMHSSWADQELNASLYRAISSGKQRIVPVMLEECTPPALIAGYARIDAGRAPSEIAIELEKAILRKTAKPRVRCTAV
jgi:TIR domain